MFKYTDVDDVDKLGQYVDLTHVECKLTHHGDVILDQQRGFLPALFQNAHGLRQGVAMETNPIDAQHPIAWLDGSFSGETETVFVRRLPRDRRPSDSDEVRGHLPVSRTAWPDVRDDDGARLVPVFMGATCTQSHDMRVIITHTHTHTELLTSDDEAEAVSLFVKRDLNVLEHDP